MRTSKQEDISKVIELMNICFNNEIERGMELPSVGQIQTRIEEEELILLIEEEGTRIIAFAMIMIETNEHPAEIQFLAVDPNFQGIGVGARLIGASLDLTREHNWNKIKIIIPPVNLPLRKLMARFEFIPEGYLRKEFLGEDVILYSYLR